MRVQREGATSREGEAGTRLAGSMIWEAECIG